MSSSRGIGASASDIAELLPPQVLRFLLIRTPPKKALNFSPNLESITRLYADYDRMLSAIEEPEPSDSAVELRQLSITERSLSETSRVGKILPWDTIVSLVQMPHIDFLAQARQRFDPPMSEPEIAQLEQRVASAECWLENYAGPDERIELLAGTDEIVTTLTNTQRAFLHVAGTLLASSAWQADEIQATLFDAARITPIHQAEAFDALYRMLLGRSAGPRAGNFLAFLNQPDLVRRLLRISFSQRLLLDDTSVDPQVALATLTRRKESIDHIVVDHRFDTVYLQDGPEGHPKSYIDGLGVARLSIVTRQGRREVLNVALTRFKGEGTTVKLEEDLFGELLLEFFAALQRDFDVRLK